MALLALERCSIIYRKGWVEDLLGVLNICRYLRQVSLRCLNSASSGWIAMRSIFHKKLS